MNDMWSDERFDYFRTSDGYLYKVPRNFEREAAEAEFERYWYWELMRRWAMRCLIYSFIAVDVVFLDLTLYFSARFRFGAFVAALNVLLVTSLYLFYFGCEYVQSLKRRLI